MTFDTNDIILCFVLGHSWLENLTAQAMTRLNSAFRPSTQAAYTTMFRLFVGFCIYMKVVMADVHVGVLLAFLECLHVNSMSLYDKKLHYFIKSLKINHPLCITKCNSIGIDDLYTIVACCVWLPPLNGTDSHNQFDHRTQEQCFEASCHLLRLAYPPP